MNFFDWKYKTRYRFISKKWIYEVLLRIPPYLLKVIKHNNRSYLLLLLGVTSRWNLIVTVLETMWPYSLTGWFQAACCVSNSMFRRQLVRGQLVQGGDYLSLLWLQCKTITYYFLEDPVLSWEIAGWNLVDAAIFHKFQLVVDYFRFPMIILLINTIMS